MPDDPPARASSLRAIPSHRYGAPVQLDLPFWGGRTLQGAGNVYLANCTDGLSDATLKEYGERLDWLVRELGELTPLEDITFVRLEGLCRRFRGVLRNVTVKKRLTFLLMVMKHARARGEFTGQVPELPRLKKDSESRDVLHTVEQWKAFREFLAPGRFRDLYDLAFWTGQHKADLRSMKAWMLDVDRPVHNEKGEEVGRGMWLRRNQKNQVEPVWLPMEPELVVIARQLLAARPLRDDLLVGEFWNDRRTFHQAADRAVAAGYEIPRCSLTDLRRSFASMLIGRERPLEYVRLALGHKGAMADAFISGARGPMAVRPNVATTHYIRSTPALAAQGVTRK
jgi:integrase